MIQRMTDVPDGVIALEAEGKLTKQDYTAVLEPALKEAVDSGELRVLFVLRDFDGVEPAAMVEDLKTGLRTVVGKRDAWKRFAFLTNTEWVAKATRGFEWLIPGEVFVGGLDDVDKAKAWVAA
jgi:hypothetical protein